MSSKQKTSSPTKSGGAGGGGAKKADVWLDDELNKLASSDKKKSSQAQASSQQQEPHTASNTSPVQQPNKLAAPSKAATAAAAVPQPPQQSHRDKPAQSKHASKKQSNDIEEEIHEARDSKIQGSSEIQESYDDYENGYGDDFEDYNDDFEDFDEAPPKKQPDPTSSKKPVVSHAPVYAVPPPVFDLAINGTAPVQAKPSFTTPPSKQEYVKLESNLPERKMIDLETSRKQNQKAKTMHASEIKRLVRAKDLAKLIELDVVAYTIMELSPMNEYDLYIRSFGTSNTLQSFTQTNDDNTDRDIQTEDWDIEDKWTQAPPEGLKDCESAMPTLPWISDGRDTQFESTSGKKSKRTHFQLANIDSLKLVKFLRKSSQVIESLLEENTVEAGIVGSQVETTKIPFAQGQIHLAVPEFFSGRQFQKVCYSPLDPRIVLTSLSKPTNGIGAGFWANKGILCLWRLTEPKRPYKVLICESEPTCFCFGVTKPNLIFAGTQDGSVQAWNLLDSEKMGEMLNLMSSSIVIQRPSYSTDGLYSISRVHEGAIVSISSINSSSSAAAETNSSIGVSSLMQICTVDEFGSIQFWSVSEVGETATRDNINFDLGMAIGSSIRIIKGTGFSCKKMQSSGMFSAPEVKIIDCKFNPTNSESFLVSTDMGVIFNESRFQNSCYPRSYQRQHSIIETPSDPVVAIDFNPFEKDVFLAAFKSDIGVIGLYHVKEDQPLVTFKLPPNNAARGAAGGATFNTLQAVRWSTHRPAVFFALTSQGKLYLWDLTETDRDPVFSADVGNLKNLGCFDMSLSPGSTQVSLVKSTSSAAAPHAQNDKAAAFKLSQNSLNNASRHASISITNENGAEIYIFDGGFSEMAVGEEETMYEYLSKFIFLGGEANKGEDDE